MKLRVSTPPPGQHASEVIQHSAEDLALASPPRDLPGLVQRRLGRITWRSVVRLGHPLLQREEVTLEAWLGVPHIRVVTSRDERSVIETTLARQKHTRSVGLTVPSMITAALMAARSDMLVTAAPWPVLEPLLEDLGLVALEVPLPIPEVPIVSLWPETLQADPGHRWFRDTVGTFVSKHLEGA